MQIFLKLQEVLLVFTKTLQQILNGIEPSCSDSIIPLLIILVSWHTADSFLIFIATSYILNLMCTKYEYHEVTRQPIEILNLIHMYEVMCA